MNEPKRVITIMADLGMGPYEWEMLEGESDLGVNIADAATGFDLEYSVSAEF